MVLLFLIPIRFFISGFKFEKEFFNREFYGVLCAELIIELVFGVLPILLIFILG
jgi:ABC-type multidrug transport system permease subunit